MLRWRQLLAAPMDFLFSIRFQDISIHACTNTFYAVPKFIPFDTQMPICCDIGNLARHDLKTRIARGCVDAERAERFS